MASVPAIPLESSEQQTTGRRRKYGAVAAWPPYVKYDKTVQPDAAAKSDTANGTQAQQDSDHTSTGEGSANNEEHLTTDFAIVGSAAQTAGLLSSRNESFKSMRSNHRTATKDMKEGGSGDTQEPNLASGKPWRRLKNGEKGGWGLLADYTKDGDISLISELRDRVRHLNQELKNEEGAKKKHNLEANEKVEKLRQEKDLYLRKYQTERENLAAALEDARTKEEALAALRNEHEALKERHTQLNEMNAKGWECVAAQNITLQKLRRKQAKLNDGFAKEAKERAKAQRTQSSIANQIVPLQERNLEMQYRLQLQNEWHTSTLSQVTSLEKELMQERKLTEQMTRQIKTAVRAKTLALEESTHKQLLVNDLYEDNTEMQNRFDTLEHAHSILQTDLTKVTEELQLSESELSSVSGQLAIEKSERMKLEDTLNTREAENHHLKEDIKEAKLAMLKEAAEKKALAAEKDQVERELNLMKIQFPAVQNVPYTAKARATLQLTRLQQDPHGIMSKSVEHPPNNGWFTAR